MTFTSRSISRRPPWSGTDTITKIMAFREIIDNMVDEDMESNGINKSTKGWQIQVEMADDSTHWIPLRDVKDTNPVEMAEYAVTTGIDQEPAFRWWVPYELRKRERIINKVKTKYWRTTHKYGVRLPKSVADAVRIDRENGNTFWQDALNKEMSKAKVA